MDAETNKILSDADKIRYTLETEGWQIMASRLDEMINQICDIRALVGVENREQELQRRIDSVALIEDWLRIIKGDVAQAKDMGKSETNFTHIIIKQ